MRRKISRYLERLLGRNEHFTIQVTHGDSMVELQIHKVLDDGILAKPVGSSKAPDFYPFSALGRIIAAPDGGSPASHESAEVRRRLE